MKSWLVLGGYALAGTLVGVMVATIVAAHSAAATPPAATT